MEEPLYFPRVYDDVECPCLVVIESTFYLIGSIREDVEVHYWWSESFRGEYQAFRHNVLLPRGTYAARVMKDGPHLLIFTFYLDGINVETGTRSLPPPKQLRRTAHGGLELVSYYRWQEKRQGQRPLRAEAFHPHLQNPTATRSEPAEDQLRFSSRSGFEFFTAGEDDGAWIWEGELQVVSQGQCGLVFGMDDQLNGYFLGLDGVRGTTSIRAWGIRPERMFQNYVYEEIQAATFPPKVESRYLFRLIRWGSYIELSLDGVVRLSLVDARFSGHNLGIYLESAEVILRTQVLHTLEAPRHDPD